MRKRYMLTDGNDSYIRHDQSTNKYVPIRGIKYASSWIGATKADNILHMLSKALRDRYYRIEVEQSPVSDDVPMDDAGVDTNGASHFTVSEINEKIDTLKAALVDLEGCKDDLIRQHSSIDLEITDIQHYIEFKNLNAYEGYMAYKRLQGVLLRRRNIKDALAIIDSTYECKAGIDGLQKRKYTPRVLSGLFDGGAK